MSLATRCTACGTAFRVVQDQLKVSEGWVRCGRCSEVFNALEGLFDLERAASTELAEMPAATAVGGPVEQPFEEPVANGDVLHVGPGIEPPSDSAIPGSSKTAVEPSTEPSAGPSSDPAPDLSIEAHAEAEANDHRSHDHGRGAPIDDFEDSDASLDAQIDAHLFGARRAPKRGALASHLSQRDRPDFSDARFDSDLLADGGDPDGSADASESFADEERPRESGAAPDFVRRAERRARWQRPRVRAGLAVAAVLLGTALVLQAGNHFRDIAAAHWPAVRPALAAWCSAASCVLEAPRRIEDISVDSSTLTRAPGLDAFRLAVTLRSHSSLALAMPSVDLSLTDASGKLVARRALAAKEFDPRTTVLQPGAEIALQALLNTGAGRVTGYTVEIFYP